MEGGGGGGVPGRAVGSAERGSALPAALQGWGGVGWGGEEVLYLKVSLIVKSWS